MITNIRNALFSISTALLHEVRCRLCTSRHFPGAVCAKIPEEHFVTNCRRADKVLLLVALLAFLPLRLFAGEPSAEMKLDQTYLSPRGDIRVEHYVTEWRDYREVWLAPAKKPSDRVVLIEKTEANFGSPVLFSPDQRWLIAFSSLSDLLYPHLFQRGQGLHYKEVKNANISEKVWRFIGKQHPLVLTHEFDHQYVNVVRWASDSRAFLVAASGHSSTNIVAKQASLDQWLCVFTIDGLSVSLDLGLMNRGAFQGGAPTSRSVEAEPSGRQSYQHAIERPKKRTQRAEIN